LLPAPAYWFTRYLAEVSRPPFAAALFMRRRYLAVMPRPMLVAPRRFLVVEHSPLPATPLVERRRYLLMFPDRCSRRRACI
jgi:hypothetical protein